MAKQNGRPLGLLERFFRARQKADQGIAPVDDAFRDQYPNVWDLLTSNKADEDKVCDPAKLEISNSAGDWLVVVRVPAFSCWAELMVATFAEVLPRLEQELASGKIKMRYNLKRKAKTRPAPKEPDRS